MIEIEFAAMVVLPKIPTTSSGPTTTRPVLAGLSVRAFFGANQWQLFDGCRITPYKYTMIKKETH